MIFEGFWKPGLAIIYLMFRRNPILPRLTRDVPDAHFAKNKAETLISKIPRWALDKIDARHQVLGPALACGRNACVWEAANSRVVKITSDSFDAYTAMLVKDERPAGFVPVYEVYGIPGTASRHFSSQLFVIVSQLVKPLTLVSQEDPSRYNLALWEHMHDLHEYLVVYRDTADLDDVKEGIKEWEKESSLESERKKKNPEVTRRVAEAFLNIWKFSVRHDWWAGEDAHPANWGLDEANNLVLLDFGLGY